MAEIDWESGEIKQPEGATADTDWEQGEIKPPPEPKGFLGHARDLGLSAVKSAIAVPETLVGLADIPTGGRVGKFLENADGAIGFRPKQAKEFLSEFHTDQYKEQQRQFQEADGVMDKTGVALQNPSLIANAVTESIAPMLAGGVAARGLMAGTRLGQAGARAAERGASAAQQAQAAGRAAAAAGAIGEGTMMAGSQASAIRQETDDGLLTPTQAGAAVATGLAGTLFGYLGGRVAQRFGLGDVDTMLARGANPRQVASEIAALPAKSIPRQVVEGAISEGFLEELPQSISEQIIQNLALGKQWSEGVEDAAVMGTLAGMAMGGGASLYSGMTRPEPQDGGLPPPAAGNEPPAAPPQGFTPTAERPVIDEAALGRAGVYPPAPAPIINERALEPAAPTPSQQMGLDPAAGPMSAAAALAVDTGASATMQQAAQAVDPETGEILEAGAKVPEQKQAADTPEQMRERLGFIEQQARVNGGWDRRTIEERDRLQAELAKVEPAAGQSGAATEMVEPAPAIDVSGRTDEQLRVLEKAGRDGWREAAVAEIQRRATQQPAETPVPAVEPAAQAAVEQQAPTDIAQAPAEAAPVADIKDMLAKQIPDMTDGELQQAIAHYGPAHKRTAKLQKELQKRGQGAQPAQTPAAPEQSAAADPSAEVRRQLREVEDKILAAAPSAMGAGGGDIEAAMKSRKVPVTLKAQRTRLKEQLRQTNQGELTPNVPPTQQVAPQAQTARGQEGAAAGSGRTAALDSIEQQRIENATVSVSLTPESAAETRINRKISAAGNPAEKARLQGYYDFLRGMPSKAKEQGTRLEVSYQQGWNKGKNLRENILKGKPWYETDKRRDGNVWKWDMHREGVHVASGEAKSEKAADQAIEDAKIAAMESRGDFKAKQRSTSEKLAEQPTQAPTTPEQSRPAPSQRSESAQPSEAIPPATSEGWDGMTAEQRAAVLTKPGGWSTAKGKLNVIGKQIAGRNWSAINPTTRATIERLMQGEQAANVPTAEQVDGEAQEASGQEGATSGEPAAGVAQSARTDADARAIAAYNAPQAVELDLRAKSRDTEQEGDVGIVMANRDVRFVSLAEAVEAARSEIAQGTAPTPFQIHNATGIRIGDADRVIQAAQNPEPAKASDDVALADDGKTGSKSVIEKMRARKEFTHNGVRIYPATVNVAGERKQMWGVESAENKAKREAGERHGFGDSLFDTQEEAKAHAGRQIERAQRDAERERRNAEVEAQQQAEAAARKADTINGLLDGKAPNTQELIRKALDKQVRFNGEVMTVRQYVELKAGAGTLDPGSFDEPKIKPMSRTQFNRATQREQDAHEKKMREAGTKTVYTVNGYELGKYAYDYAQHLLAVNAEPALQRHYAAQRAYADHRKQFLANFTGQELRKQEKFVEAAASRFTAGRIMGLRGGLTVEVADGALGEGGTATVYMLAPSGEFVSVESMPLDRTALYRASEAGAGPAQQAEAKRYAGPADVASRAGQIELANRAGTIASLKAMNAQLRAIAPEEAWADANIEDAADLDALRDQISVALVRANRAGSAEQDSPLRKRLEEASGAELRAVFDALGLAGGARMIQAERIKALMSEDARAVSDALDDVQSDGVPAAAETPAQPPAANQPALTGPRRNPAQVSVFAPYAAGDIVTIDGQDWQVQQDMGGWYLTNTGNWRGTHPTIQRIRSMADLIREIERASTEKEAPKNEKPAPAESPKAKAKTGPATAQQAIDAFNADDSAAAMDVVARLKLEALNEVGAAIGFRPQIHENAKSYRSRLAEVAEKLTKTGREEGKKKRALWDRMSLLASDWDRMERHTGTPEGSYDGKWMTHAQARPYLLAEIGSLQSSPYFAEIRPMVENARPSIFNALDSVASPAESPKVEAKPTAAEATAADLLTPEQARSLMTWEDLGQRDNVKSMRLAFFESAERMAAKRGAMNYGTIESYQGGKWNIDGTTYPTLKAAKAAAEEAALVRLANDGYVAQPFAAYDAVARTYGYEVRADGAIGGEGKFPGPTIKEKGGRLRVESGKGDLLGSYPATPESLGRFLESFWGAEKQAAQPASGQPTSDRDQFTVERVDEDQRQTLTFKRGETVKVSGKYPMETGQIDGISNARKEFRIGGAWLPFGYAYKTEYDEFAAPRRELEEMIANAEKRIADGAGFQRDGYPIRDAREHAKRYSLEGYDDTLNDLAKRGQAALDKYNADGYARMEAERKAAVERREAEQAADAAKYAGPVKMTMAEWKRIGRDFKSFNGGKRTVMQDGRIRRVEIVKEKAEAPEGSFMDPSLPVQTGVNARMVVIDRPAVDDGVRRPGDADPEVAFSATLPRDRNAVRIGITEKGLVRAMRLQFDGLAEITGKLLERGRAGKRGGVIVVGTADNAEIGRIVAERTGRKLDSTMRKFSSAGRLNGFYDPKTGLTFLVAPNLNPVTATAVMLHEMMHGQQRQKIDARALEMVRNRHGLKDEGLRAFLDRVMLRMIKAGEVGNAAEASAYIVEQAVIEGRSAGYTFADNAFMQWVDAKIGKRVGDFLRSFAGMIRTWMLRNGLGAKTMTVDDFVGYAMAGLDRAAAGEVRGRSATVSASQSQDRSVGDAPAQEAQRVQSAIEGKTLIEAAQFLTRSKDGAKAAVAKKVMEKLQRLEKAGVALDLKVVHRGDMVPASMANSRGYTETGFDEKGRDIVVWLNGADVTGKVGTEEEVLLHELVHAATAGMVFYGTQTPDSLAGKHARDLMAVTDAIAEHIRKRFDAADAGKETLTEFEQDMRDGANNAFRSDDEVLAWALSNSEAQAYLETIPYRSGSMWSNFVQAVRNLLGLGARNDTALSEVLRVAERILTDDAPAAGRAAFWHKRNIRMAQQQVRGSIVQTAERGADDLQFSRSGLRELASRATAELNNTLTAPGKLSWWHKTVGTMYNLAERSPAFRPVFQAAQGFIDDVSHYAADAAERAPKLLPRLDTWRDIMKSPISAEDNAAVGKPIFEGTLSWTRDADGRPVRVDALIDAASGLSIEEMAAELVSRGAIEERTLRMWRGMPDAQFESAIRTRYENSFLQPGIVWTDDELVSLFSLTPAQIELYREFRAAVDRSLDTMARADMLRFAGEDVRFLRDPVMEADTLREAASLIVMNLNEQANAKPDRAEQFMATSQGVMDRMEKVLKLQAQGYAPLSRFGKYTVDVVVDGNREYFGLFETAREANKMAERMRAEFGAGTVTQGTLSDEAFRLFAGITPESLELFGNMLGLDSTGDEAQDRAFQEYLRLTKTNRSALRRLIHRKGIAGFSEDVSRVLASFAYSNARQTAAGLHMGDLSQAVSDIPKEQGELKDVAVKLSEYIKNPQEEAQAIRGLLFAQYLGGSVASAFVNMTQPAAVTFPWLSQHGGAKMAAAEIGKAAKHIATRGHRYESDLAEALKAAEEDGVVSPQEVHQLMAQARGSGSLTAGDGTRAGNARALASNSITRLSAAWGKLFSAAEQLNRRITFIAAYRVAKQKRMEDPAAFARRAVQETQFVYSKASKMQWGRGAVGGTLMTFKTYSVAYMELMSRLWSQGAPGSAERKAGRKAVALMLAMVLLMGGGGGLPFMEDAEDLIDGIAQIAGYNVSTKKARQQFLIDAFGADAADFIERGVSGLPGVPLDVSGRLGLGNLIPGTGIFLDRSNHTRDVLELLGPVGDLGNRIVTGARKALSGDLGGAALEVSPVAVRNVAKGVDMAVMDQYRDTRGRKVLDTTDLEAALKAIGFQPASVAKVQDANYLNQRAKDFYSLSADRISATWAAGIYEKDSDKVQEARDMIAQWNEDNPDQPMMIRMPNILRRVREMGKDKAQRIADTAPRAMRQQLREELLRQ